MLHEHSYTKTETMANLVTLLPTTHAVGKHPRNAPSANEKAFFGAFLSFVPFLPFLPFLAFLSFDLPIRKSLPLITKDGLALPLSFGAGGGGSGRALGAGGIPPGPATGGAGGAGGAAASTGAATGCGASSSSILVGRGVLGAGSLNEACNVNHSTRAENDHHPKQWQAISVVARAYW